MRSATYTSTLKVLGKGYAERISNQKVVFRRPDVKMEHCAAGTVGSGDFGEWFCGQPGVFLVRPTFWMYTGRTSVINSRQSGEYRLLIYDFQCRSFTFPAPAGEHCQHAGSVTLPTVDCNLGVPAFSGHCAAHPLSAAAAVVSSFL